MAENKCDCNAGLDAKVVDLGVTHYDVTQTVLTKGWGEAPADGSMIINLNYPNDPYHSNFYRLYVYINRKWRALYGNAVPYSK